MGENEDEVPLNLPEPPVTYKVRINHRYLLPKSNLKSDSFIACLLTFPHEGQLPQFGKKQQIAN